MSKLMVQSDSLKKRQHAAQRLEEEIVAFLLQFDPARDLKISDAKTIAGYARNRSFDLFEEAMYEPD